MDEEPHSTDQTDAGSVPKAPSTKHRHGRWRRFIRSQMRKSHQHRVEREQKYAQESPEDRAARKTANATVWIAVFTVVLAAASILTLVEVSKGGSDTHALAVAADAEAVEATAQVEWSEISSRPYLQIAKVVIIEKPTAGKQLGVQWDMRNGGKSPAVNAECLSCTIFLEDNRGARSFYTSYAPADLPPVNISEEAPATLQLWTRDDIGQSQVSGLENGSLSIYVKGQIQYGSVYSRSPYPPFKFCYFYTAGGWENALEPCIISSSDTKTRR